MASGESRQSILEAVQRVIVRDGVRGASLRQVAQEAGVSLGLLSYHFDDKEHLIISAFDQATQRLLEASHAAAAEVTDPAERVRAFLRGAYSSDFLDGDYLRLRISLWAVALTDEAVAKVDAAFFDDYAAAYRELIAAALPDLARTELERRTVDAIALSNGVWLDWARYRDRSNLEAGLSRCDQIALG